MKKLYFAHPVNVFGTDLKLRLMWVIREAFPGREIEDPDQPHHQQGYKDWKARLENDKTKQGGMSYYYDVVLPQCHGCVAMPFLDEKFGAGVAGEAKFFVERYQPLFILRYDMVGLLWAVLTAAYAGRMEILESDPSVVLSIEETRARTWMSPEEYNKVKRPYETAHLIDFDKSKWTSERLKAIQKYRLDNIK